MSEIDILHDIIRDNGLSADRVVLIGGLAIYFYTGTEVSKDVDFAIMTEDYERIPKTDMWGVKQVQYEWGYADFLNPSNYVAGQHKGNDIIDYIKRHRSFKKDGLYIANPEVVFYTRLVIPNWSKYIKKSIRDLGAGLLREKDGIYTGVKSIADVFGTRDIVNDRLEVLEEYVRSNFPGSQRC